MHRNEGLCFAGRKESRKETEPSVWLTVLSVADPCHDKEPLWAAKSVKTAASTITSTKEEIVLPRRGGSDQSN